MALTEAIVGVDPNSLEVSLLDKCKGKELTASPSKRSKKKVGETILAFLPSSSLGVELWKSQFSACKLEKQVMVANSAKVHDTSMAFARAIMLLNDVATLF